MKIVYSGSFLGEGLRQAGHEVIEFGLRSDCCFSDLVEEACAEPDLVLVELWGKTELPVAMHACRWRTAAYCIDAPINEFWLRPLSAVFDDVFVDQLSSVAALRRHGVHAVWLPLCVLDDDIMPPQEKEYFLTFVGRTTRYRTKRQNLLRLLQEHCPVNIVENVNRREMLSLFARSHVVLNENLFSGLTLRVFQALASGSILLTEEGGLGVAGYFTAGEHLLCYNAANILQILSDMAADIDKYRDIGRRGQDLCREYHTSSVRARAFLDCLAKDAARNPRQASQARAVAEAEARYFHAMRFGGSFTEGLRVFADHGRLSGENALSAAHGLGSVQARRGHEAGARQALSLAAGLEGTEGFVAAAKLALTYLYREQYATARRILSAALARLPQGNPACRVPDIGVEGNEKQAVFVFLAKALLELGRVFDLGFLKPGREKYPDYAFEYAQLAWDEGHTAEALDLIIRCAAACQAESEIIDILKSAIAEGVATDRQILYTAELAIRLYDHRTAKAITGSLHRVLAPRTGGECRVLKKT